RHPQRRPLRLHIILLPFIYLHRLLLLPPGLENTKDFPHLRSMAHNLPDLARQPNLVCVAASHHELQRRNREETVGVQIGHDYEV
ncbi:hypothetical protein HK102_007586, partial [Quaeritorhiza haematococci]